MKGYKLLPRSFFMRDPAAVAYDLLGKLLVRKTDEHIFVGKIVEVEAYLATGDSAAHSFKGETLRTRSLYKDGGHAYVHSMRQYNLLDVVVGESGSAGSVLIRAVEPCEGIEYMKALAGTEDLEKIANGPGKVGRAFQITRVLDGIDLVDPNSVLILAEPITSIDHEVEITTRIGISTAQDMPLRFFIKDSKYISKKR
ncbi:MAG TPA: DNA-3-methyladenine glycosylase [Candidatus Paceibacterota bacterium]